MLEIKQQEFINLAMLDKNIFLTGKAGTGKSWILNHLVNLLSNKNIVKLASTGCAASLIEGQTLHSFFSLRPYGVLQPSDANFVKMEKRNMYRCVDIVIVDEVSMVRPDWLDCAFATLEKAGTNPFSIQWIFVGDLKQLQPVLTDNDKLQFKYKENCFLAADVIKQLNLQTVELDVIRRQSNPFFINALNCVREGKETKYFNRFVNKKEQGVFISPLNALVNEKNKTELDKIKEQAYVLKGSITGDFKPADFMTEENITVKNGAKIMYLRNDKENNLVNGSIGTLKIENKQLFFVDSNNVETPIVKHAFKTYQYVINEKKELVLEEKSTLTQYPIKLAWVITIHKSQGMTFDKVTIDMRTSMFASGQEYVAKSRCSNIQGLTILK